MQETWVRSLGQEDPLEKEMGTHSSILAWEIPWTEEPGGYSPWGCKRIGHNLAAKQPKGGWVPNSVFKQVALYHVNKCLIPILEIHIAQLPYFKLPW